ncbi:MAG TPA: thrombospondin [Actinoplanes sp.]|nr:thrombospondin [Actinoplanes sp.]
MRIPTFSRHSSTDTADDERPTVATGDTAPVRERMDAPPPPPRDRGTATVTEPTDVTTTRWAGTNRADANRAEANRAAAERDAANRDANVQVARRDRFEHEAERPEDRTPVIAGPRPRASLLATLGLICAVVAVMLVLSGPLLGYGLGVAVLALILSLSGIHATGRRHVAGKSDALIGMVLSLAAIVVGVLALTGSLSWLGTDVQPVNSLREWLDTQFVNRF